MQPIPEDAIDLDPDNVAAGDVEMADGTVGAAANGSGDRPGDNPDERISIRASEKRISKDEEFSDSEDEAPSGGDAGDRRRDQRSHKPNKSSTKRTKVTETDSKATGDDKQQQQTPGQDSGVNSAIGGVRGGLEKKEEEDGDEDEGDQTKPEKTPEGNHKSQTTSAD